MANNSGTSGTFTWSLTNSNLTIEAFDRCGIKPEHITRHMLKSAYRSLNLELQSWTNRPVNLWEVDLQQFYVRQGVPNYPCPPETQIVLDCYATILGTNGGQNVDRIMMPISRDEYANYPNKLQQGFSTVFWFNRLPSPTLTLWECPDGTSFQQVSYYRMKKIEDANLGNAEVPDVPTRFIDALAAGYAKRLSLKYAPDRFDLLKAEAKEAFDMATTEDIERAPLNVTPDFSSYDPTR